MTRIIPVAMSRCCTRTPSNHPQDAVKAAIIQELKLGTAEER